MGNIKYNVFLPCIMAFVWCVAFMRSIGNILGFLIKMFFQSFSVYILCVSSVCVYMYVISMDTVHNVVSIYMDNVSVYGLLSVRCSCVGLIKFPFPYILVPLWRKGLLENRKTVIWVLGKFNGCIKERESYNNMYVNTYTWFEFYI